MSIFSQLFATAMLVCTTYPMTVAASTDTTPSTPSTLDKMASETPKQDPQLIKGELANGLTYYIRPAAEPKGRFSIRLRVNTGSLNEKDHEQGISHFLEHMVFNGSTNFKRGELMPAMQREGLGLGGDANAYTSFDETVYMMDVPSLKPSTVDLAFKAMRDFADGAHLTAEALDAERGIITSEYKARDSAGYRMIKDTFRFLSDGTLIGERFPIGTLDFIRNGPRDLFLNYYKTHYVPNEMQVIVSGDVTPEQAKEWIEKYFGSMQKSAPIKADYGTLKQITAPQAKWIANKEASATDISVVLTKPFEKKADTVANRVEDLPLELAYAMLNRRFDKMTKQENCPFLGAGVNRDDMFKIIEMDMLSGRSDSKNWKASLQAMEQTIRSAITHGFTAKELDEAKKDITTSYEVAIKSWPTTKSNDLANAITKTAADGKVFTTPEENWHMIQPVLAKITPAMCQQMLKEAWDGKHPKIIIGSNIENDKGSDEILATYKESTQKEVKPYVENEIKPFDYQFGAPGQVVAQSYNKELDLTELTLSNGVKVNLKPTPFNKDNISILFTIDGGKVTKPVSQIGLDMLAGAVMNMGGFTNHSIDEIKSIFADKNVGSSFSIGEDTFVISGATNQKDFETQLQLQMAHMMYPGYRPEAEMLFRRAIPMQYAKMKHEANGALQKELPKTLFNNDVRFNFPSQEELEANTTQMVKDWLDQLLKKNYLEVSIVGDFKPEQIIPVLEKTIGSLPARPKTSTPPTTEQTKINLNAFDQTKDVTYPSTIDKTLVTLFWKAPDAFDKKKARRVNLMKGLLRERLFVGVREKMGEAYSPSVMTSASEVYPGLGYIGAISSGVVGNKDKVLDAIIEITNDLGKGNIPQDELDRARNPILNSMEKSRRQNDYWQSVIGRAQTKTDRLQASQEAIDDMKSITVEEINELAKEIFGNGKHLNLNILPDKPEKESDSDKK